MTPREQFLNKDGDLWTSLEENSADFIRKFRSTACPVMGDDDLESDDEPDVDDNPNEDEDNDDSGNDDPERDEEDKNE